MLRIQRHQLCTSKCSDMLAFRILYLIKAFAFSYYIGLFLTIPYYFSPPSATNTTMNKQDETVKETGLLALPREIRDKIYEELFYLDEFQIQQFRTRSKLDPSILRVSRQLYREASEILYERNSWVTATATDGIVSSWSWQGNDSVSGFPGRQPVTRSQNDRFSDCAILNMDLQRDSDSGASRTDLVIPLAAMPNFCRFLSDSSRVEDTDLVLHFNCHAKENLQSRLLGYLGQARGLRSVNIANPEPTWASINTSLLMTHPYKRLAEILNTMLAYQDSSEKELRYGRILVARNIIQDGADFFDWWSDNMRREMARLTNFDTNDLDNMFEVRAEMGFSSASLSLRSGNIKSAQKAVEDVLERLSQDQRLSSTHKASAHYHMAQTFEALGWGNAALYSYLQALRLNPGYSDADAAVDQMERNLGSGTTLEDARVKHNLDHVLERFRSQSAHSVTIRERDYKIIFRKFEGTAAEIRSVDRRSYSEVSRLYRKTQSVLLTMRRPIWYTWTPCIEKMATGTIRVIVLGESTGVSGEDRVLLARRQAFIT